MLKAVADTTGYTGKITGLQPDVLQGWALRAQLGAAPQPQQAPELVMKITQNDLISFVPCLRQPGLKTLLHVGCGTSPKSRLPACFQEEQWKEIRLDIDPRVKPDIVASLTDMSAVPSSSADAIWSSHNLEHLEGFQVPAALREIRRVLKPGGFVLINLPNLQRIAELVAAGRAEEVMYTSPAGPITPLDMLFGHQASLARGNHYMAHRTGYTPERLSKVLVDAGFAEVRVMQGQALDLWAVAVSPECVTGQRQ